jgi:8-oxo-dGTP pyrophosphatase MutT (NUDIX family)
MIKGASFSEADILAAGLWRCDQVKCSYSPEKGESESVDPAYINEFWNSYQRRYPSAFNGQMLGLIGIERCDTDALRLAVKRTSYAEYVATRDHSFPITHPRMRRANPIGITALALTSDDQVVVTRRSASAEQNPGMPYFVGGYAEPPLNEQLPDDLICANALRELTEELGVANIDAMIAIGMAMDRVYCHPEMFVTTRLRVRASEIQESWERATGRQEASKLMFLPVAELLSTADEVLFPDGVTWSFAVGTFLLKQCRERIGPALAQTRSSTPE